MISLADQGAMVGAQTVIASMGAAPLSGPLGHLFLGPDPQDILRHLFDLKFLVVVPVRKVFVLRLVDVVSCRAMRQPAVPIRYELLGSRCLHRWH